MRLSVITRTLGRPLLLARAARSIAAAKVADMEWIIVEDKKDVSSETRQIATSVCDIKINIIASGGLGRTVAANSGLKAAHGAFVHIHDDDDTIESEFYGTLLDFLKENPRYSGARSFCRRIYERIEGEKIRLVKARRIYPERRIVSLTDAAEVFAYPPIGVIFNRAKLLEIGGFDESFEVGEDYELLLRYLTHANIGTHTACLANVHVRLDGEGHYANSLMERRFAEEDALFRDELLRRDLVAGRFGLGFLLALGRQSRHRRSIFDYLDAARRRIGW